MLYAPRIPTPPPISDIRKVKKENMPAKPKISKDQLFPEKVERAKQIVENSNIKEMVSRVMENPFLDFTNIHSFENRLSYVHTIVSKA